MTLCTRKTAILLCLAVPALVAAALSKTVVRIWIAHVAEQEAEPHATPERRYSLLDDIEDIWAKDWKSPAPIAPFLDPTYYPYTATDFFADRKVAQLAQAARDGDLERLEALVARGVDVNARGSAPEAEGLTPLMYAMSGKTLKGFERLLQRGADPNLQAERGESAVTFAVKRTDPKALKILLAHRADPNLKARLPNGELLEMEPTPIYDAISFRRPESARLLIKAGADLNARGFLGKTPLLHAEAASSYDVMYVLLEAGADFRAKNEVGHTLVYAILNSDEIGRCSPEEIAGAAARQKCIEWLTKHGVDWAEEKVNFAELNKQQRAENQRKAQERRKRWTETEKPYGVKE